MTLSGKSPETWIGRPASLRRSFDIGDLQYGFTAHLGFDEVNHKKRVLVRDWWERLSLPTRLRSVNPPHTCSYLRAVVAFHEQCLLVGGYIGAPHLCPDVPSEAPMECFYM